ncbi:MAG: hypothetical protein EOP53_06785, partial [Sphingobacteriales bacterium]
CAINMSDIAVEKESIEYAASSFRINTHKIIYRQSKITPAKTGQFVTLWKRDNAGITQPFDMMDDFDFIIIASKKEDSTGIFVFSKKILSEHGIISNNKKGGKRGIRVYPPWDTANNKQAIKTQQWQNKYFINLNEQGYSIEKIFP